MIAEEIFYNLSEKYGDRYDWHMIPLTDQYFVSELRREIGSDHFLCGKRIWAVPKCDRNDDVLFVTDHDMIDDNGTSIKPPAELRRTERAVALLRVPDKKPLLYSR